MDSCYAQLAERFPTVLAGFERGSVALHDPKRPGAGVTVSYALGPICASISLYDRDLDNIPEGPRSSVIYGEANRELAVLGERVERGLYESVHIIDQLVTSGAREAEQFFAIEYEFQRGDEAIGAGVYLTGHDGLIVRLTLEHTEGRTGAARALVRALGAFLGA